MPRRSGADKASRKRNRPKGATIKRILYVLFALVVVLSATGFSDLGRGRDVLYQISTIDALLAGIYDGETTYQDLRRHGGFGIGTFQSLDGEMIALGGKFYQIRTDGKAYPVKPSTKTPFAAVTFFDADQSVEIDRDMDYAQLENYLDDLLPTKNIFYAIRIQGSFKYVKTRSVPKQEKPYRPLVEVVKNQAIFEFHDVKGTIVGLRCPAYVKGINVPGYHFHFLTADKKAGGHVLACNLDKVRIGIDFTHEFHLVLPESREFYQEDLSKEKHKEVEQVEH